MTLSLTGIRHRFSDRLVLDEVNLHCAAGQIHALAGQNGAGKTTLVNIATGLLQPDQGEIRIHGEIVPMGNPRAAEGRGIGVVHQHFQLVQALTVAENLSLKAPHWWWPPRRRSRHALEIMRRHGLALPPDQRVSDLSVGEKQRLEILRALEKSSSVLILDEPTAALSSHEVEDLFARLEELKNRGRAILFISHKIPELARVADHVTLLDRGRVIFSSPWTAACVDRLREVLGATAAAAASPDESVPAQNDVVLQLSDLFAEGLGPVDLAATKGSIVGIAGIAGNGQDQLAEVLLGLREVTSGRCRLPDRRRIGFLPGDRHGTALVLELSIAENLTLSRRERVPFWLSDRALARIAADKIERFDVRCQSSNQPVSTLSGGNQQRLVAARELDGQPELIIAQDPTRGLDLAATRFVHRQLRDARQRGAAVLLVSTDLEELLQLCDQVLVASRGTLRPVPLDRGQILAAMMDLEESAPP